MAGLATSRASIPACQNERGSQLSAGENVLRELLESLCEGELEAPTSVRDVPARISGRRVANVEQVLDPEREHGAGRSEGHLCAREGEIEHGIGRQEVRLVEVELGVFRR